MKQRSNDTGRFALRAVALAAACLALGNAHGLGLGRLTVNSALGETLKAEVDVASITPEEAGSLAVRIASPDAYRAAGVEYNNVLPSARVQLVKRADGRSMLRLSSDRAVQEPFVDVIIEATWSSGRLVREYTMLFDPPAVRMAQAAPPAAPAVVTPLPSARNAAPATPTPAPTPATTRAEAPRQAAPRSAASVPETVRVKSGDTLFGIAGRTQRPGASLDQMLVSLFRDNPRAFMGDNMNRMKAGAVLTVPSAEKAAAVSESEARSVIVAQSADFDAYRQRLAGNVAPAAEAPATRQASGKVQTQVDDRKAGEATTPDRLTLSQGAKASAPEAAVSRDSEKRDNQARLAELARNVEDLKKLQNGSAPAGSPAAAPTGAPPAAATGGPTVVAAAPPPAAAPEPAPAAALAPATAPVAAPTPPAVAPTPAPAPAAEPESPGMIDSLLENPMVLPGAGLLVLLLLGYGIWRMRSRGSSEAGETSFLESRLQPDSFFGASGGQRIDTHDAGTATSAGAASSMNYSLSQLDAIGDVDPVAEADVYLAYGRDLQAEEILKEAMRSAPERMAVRSKLLEVYAKRRDLKSYELLASQMYNLTQGNGPEWEQAQQQGLTIDPENPLYQPDGQPEEVRDAQGQVVKEPLGASTMPFAAAVGPPTFQPAADATLDAPDLDLGPDTMPGASVPMPFHDDTLPAGGQQPRRAAPEPVVDLDVDLPATAELADAADSGPIDFDLSELDTLSPITDDTAPGEEPLLDFGELAGEPPGPGELGASDPMLRKLELAEEFRQIGDVEGARDLLEEVIARSEGSLRAKAQGMLDQLE